MGWVRVRDRLPEKAGAYLVRRRGRGRLPAFEDELQFTPAKEITPGMTVTAATWQNSCGVVITSVVEWWEAET